MKPIPDITFHVRVRNEECFIRAALLSILPIAKRVLIYDTGSTDATPREIAAVKSDKIEYVQTRSMTPQELTELRNQMIDETTTEWFMLLDGDEIYPPYAVERLADQMQRIPDSVHRIVMNRKHFVSSPNFISGLDAVGRIFRTQKVRHGVASPDFLGVAGHETPYLIEAPLTPWKKFSAHLPKDIFFFHCQYLTRSSKDSELKTLRRWRKPPFPVMPYFGPWPDSFPLDGALQRMTPELFVEWLRLNAKNFWTRCFEKSSWSLPGLWQFRSWPSKDLLVYDRERGMCPLKEPKD